MFLLKNREGSSDRQTYCKIHSQRIIQLGNCLSCNTISSICEAKGCIKHHQ